MYRVKIYLILFFLIIPFSFSKADNIKDFEIEGISVGESLLSYLTINEIKTAEENATYYKDQKYIIIFLPISSSIYDFIQATYSPNDENYILEAIEGVNDFPNDIDSCNNIKKEITDEVTNLIKDYDIVEDEGEHEGDTYGLSVAYSTWIYPKAGGYFSVTCVDYSDEAKNEMGWIDGLSVVVGSEKLKQFLMNEAYK